MRQLASLKAWTEANAYARAAYRCTMEVPLKRHFGLADQIRRAAVSIPANIVEGYTYGTRAQLVRYLRIALSSARELNCHLEFAHDLALVNRGRARALAIQGDMVVRLLVGLLNRMSS